MQSASTRPRFALLRGPATPIYLPARSALTRSASCCQASSRASPVTGTRRLRNPSWRASIRCATRRAASSSTRATASPTPGCPSARTLRPSLRFLPAPASRPSPVLSPPALPLEPAGCRLAAACFAARDLASAPFARSALSRHFAFGQADQPLPVWRSESAPSATSAAMTSRLLSIASTAHLTRGRRAGVPANRTT